MPMASQVELQNRYADLLKPIKDLTRNWNVDVASQLEEYIEEIAQITISFDDGMTKMNFAEAALLIQGSTCVYSRKVEYLHALVYQTLDLVANKKKQGQAPPTNGDADADLSFVQRMEDDQLLSLDDIPVANNIDMDEQMVPRFVSTIPRTPLSLVPLMDYEKTNSIPLYSNTGELIGSHLDFKMNTSIIHPSGALLLEPLEHLVLQVELNDGRSIAINQHTPAHHISRLLPPLASAGASPALPDRLPDLDDSVSAMDGACHQTTPSPEPGRRERRVRIAEEQKTDNPWALLDPHDPGSGIWNKSFKKGVTYRVPQSLKNKKDRKRKKSNTSTPSEPLAEFIRRTFYSCSWQFPKNLLKAPLSSEFEAHYWEEQKRKRLQRRRENLTFKRLGREEPERVEEDDEDSLDDYQPLGGDPPDDDMEAAVEGAFEGFNQSGGHNPFMGVEPMALDDSKSDFHGEERVVQSYEDLVRNYVESTMMGVAAYMQQTDLSKKVQKWEERIKPLLIKEELRPVFDIHKYGASVIDQFKPSDPEKKREQMYFREISRNKAESEICRLFAATLQLANDGNVLIEAEEQNGEQVVDSMKLTLLSSEISHKVSEFTAPSQKGSS